MQQRPSNRHQRKRGIALVGADTGIEDRRILILVGIDPEGTEDTVTAGFDCTDGIDGLGRVFPNGALLTLFY